MAKQKKAPLYRLGKEIRIRKVTDHTFTYFGTNRNWPQVGITLMGDHQRTNAALALGAAELLLDRFPAGRRARVSARFRAHQALWQREDLIRYIHSRHGREGITWRRDEVRPWRVLRDQFYLELDEALRRVPAPGDGMAQMIRELYLAHW